MGSNKGIKPIVIYMHIPKTAGTTLRSIVRKQYKNVFRVSNYEINNREYNKNKMIKADAIMGHFSFGVHRHIGKPCTYITMMRDPVERILSLYYFILRREQNALHNKVKNMSFDQFLNNSRNYKARVSNLQTRFMCGGQKTNLELAKKNIDKHFSVVGVTELFDESISLMKQELGWTNIQYEKKNVTNNRPSRNHFSKNTINKIKELNDLDIKLYHYVQRRLLKKIK